MDKRDIGACLEELVFVTVWTRCLHLPSIARVKALLEQRPSPALISFDCFRLLLRPPSRPLASDTCAGSSWPRYLSVSF